MFFVLKNFLTKCRVANYVRRSFLVHRTHEQLYYDQYWAKYPIPLMYLWTKNIKSNTDSLTLYYLKNDIIKYFKYEVENTAPRCVIPLYNHIEKQYTVVVSDYPYIVKTGHDTATADTSIHVVRTPNGNLYLTGIAYGYKGIELSHVVLNLQNGRLLYMSGNLKQDDNIGTYVYTEPIANSFVIAMKTRKHKVNIKVINLISEDIKEINYDMSKYIDKIAKHYNILDPEIYYTKIKKVKYYEIYKTNNGVIFYRKCKIVITAYIGDKLYQPTLLVFYENNKIVVSLVSGSEDTSELMRKEYSIGAQYDISKSYLYAVIFSVGDYTLMKSNNMWIGKWLDLYYKSGSYFSNSYSSYDLQLENRGDLVILKVKNRYLNEEEDLQSLLMCLIQKQKINEIINKKYQILSLTQKSIEFVRANDILSSIQNSIDSEIFLDISQLIRKVNLTDVINNSVRKYLGMDCRIEIDKTLGQLHSSSWNLYLVVFAYCPKEVAYKVLLFVSNIKDLLSNYKILKPIAGFEIIQREFNHSSPDFRRIANMIYVLSQNFHFWNRIKNMFSDTKDVDLISNKIITTNLGLNMVYYDTTFNRYSKITASEIGNVICKLCIVRTITSITPNLQKQASNMV